MNYSIALDKWVDIRTLPGVKPMQIADTQKPLSLGFNFKFFETTINKVYMSTLGFLSASSPNPVGGYTVRRLPDPKSFLTGIIAGLWCPLVPKD